MSRAVVCLLSLNILLAGCGGETLEADGGSGDSSTDGSQDGDVEAGDADPDGSGGVDSDVESGDADLDDPLDGDVESCDGGPTDLPIIVEGPEVYLTSPLALGGFEVVESPVLASGIASVGTVLVAWETDRGRSGSAEGATEWSASFDLEPGSQWLTITASDDEGRTGRQVLEALYSPDVLFVGLPDVEPDVVYTDTPRDVTVTVAFETDEPVEGVDAVLTCPEGETRSPLAEQDDGWAGPVEVSGEVRDCTVHVEVTTDSGDHPSRSVSLRVRAPLTEARVEEILAFGDEVMESMADATDIDAAREAAWAVLRESDASSYGAADSGVWWVTREGILGSASIRDGVERGGGGGGSAAMPLPLPDPPEGGRYVLPDPHVWAMSAFSDQFGPYDEVPNYIVRRADDIHMCGGLEPDDLTHHDLADVTVERLVEPDGGFVHVSTHGDTFWANACSQGFDVDDDYLWDCPPNAWGGTSTGGEVVVFSREEPTARSVLRYLDDLLAWRLTLDWLIITDSGEVFGQDYFALAPGFVVRHMDAEGAFVIYSACRSSRNTSMGAAVLLGAGAHAYIGFTDYVSSDYAHDFSVALYDAWWFGGEELAEAFDTAFDAVGSAPDDIVDPAVPTLLTRADLGLSLDELAPVHDSCPTLRVTEVVAPRDNPADDVDGDVVLGEYTEVLSLYLTWYANEAMRWGELAVYYAEIGDVLMTAQSIEFSEFYGAHRDTLITELRQWADFYSAVTVPRTALARFTGGCEADDYSADDALLPGLVMTYEAGFLTEPAVPEWDDLPEQCLEHTFGTWMGTDDIYSFMWMHRTRAASYAGTPEVLFYFSAFDMIAAYAREPEFVIEEDGEVLAEGTAAELETWQVPVVWDEGESHTLGLRLRFRGYDRGALPSRDDLVTYEAKLFEITLDVGTGDSTVDCDY